MRRFGHLKSVTVWLMLLGFLCGMLVPAVSMAKVHREIDTEGDPTDGLGYTDGGGGYGTILGNGSTQSATPIGWVVVSGRTTMLSIGDEQIVIYLIWRDGEAFFYLSKAGTSLTQVEGK